MASSSPHKEELCALLDQWAAHFGYIDGKIKIRPETDDLTTFSTADCNLTAHAPLWGTKVGQEKPMTAAEVRKSLAGMLRYMTPERHDMHMAIHDKQLCLYFVVKIKLTCLTIMTAPLIFVVTTVDTPEGLRMSEIHERPAASVEEAQKVLVEQCGWPKTTQFVEHVGFGALS
jgi:hypothetical protein